MPRFHDAIRRNGWVGTGLVREDDIDFLVRGQNLKSRTKALPGGRRLRRVGRSEAHSQCAISQPEDL